MNLKQEIKMNRVTKEIMELLKVDVEKALEIQNAMQVDFSQCTKREFNQAARQAQKDCEEASK